MIDCAEYYTAYKDRTPVYLRQWPFNEPWRITDISETSGGFIYEIENIVTGTTVNVTGKDIILHSKYGKVEEEKSVNTDSIRYANRYYQEHVRKFGPPRTSYNQAFRLTNIGMKYLLVPKRIIFSGPCTIILWEDGSKTMARVTEGEEFDPEKGVAICFMKRALGHTETNKILREAHNQYKEENHGNKKVVDQMVEEYIEAKDQQITEFNEEENNGVHEA